MINRETIWNETYNRKEIYIGGSCVDVVLAINDNDGLYVISRLQIDSRFDAGNITAKIDMTADQMELLASNLMSAAKYQRELIAMVVTDNDERAEAQLLASAA